MLVERLQGWSREEIRFVMMNRLEQHTRGLTLTKLVNVLCGHRNWAEEAWEACYRELKWLEDAGMIEVSHTVPDVGTFFKVSVNGWLKRVRARQVANVG